MVTEHLRKHSKALPKSWIPFHGSWDFHLYIVAFVLLPPPLLSLLSGWERTVEGCVRCTDHRMSRWAFLRIVQGEAGGPPVIRVSDLDPYLRAGNVSSYPFSQVPAPDHLSLCAGKHRRELLKFVVTS